MRVRHVSTKNTLPALISAVLLCLLVFPACKDRSAPPVQEIPQTTPQKTSRYPQEAPEDDGKRMEWFKDAKFGIFIHWNPCSMTGQEISSDVPEEIYKTFNPVDFDPEEWVRIIKDSGARYLVYTAKHHDGFCMYDTATTDFSITNPAFRQAPFKRDVVKELAEAW